MKEKSEPAMRVSEGWYVPGCSGLNCSPTPTPAASKDTFKTQPLGACACDLIGNRVLVDVIQM